MNEVMNWLVENKELIALIVGLIVTVLRTTAWGKANSEALNVLSEEIERHGVKELKMNIAARSMSPGASDALDDSVNTVDPEKPTPSATRIVAREALKTIGMGSIVKKN